MKAPILALACLCAASAQALNYHSVKVTRTDGTTLSISIENATTVTIADGIHHWQSEKGTIEMPSADVHSWIFSKDTADTSAWSGIADASTSTENIAVTAAEVELSGLPADSSVTIHDLNGRSLYSTQCEGDCSISLLPYPSGIYILTVNNRSIKIQK